MNQKTVKYVVYMSSGEIIASGASSLVSYPGQQALYPPEALFVEGEADCELNYVDESGVIQDRVEIQGSPVVTGLEVDLSYLPMGCEISTEGYSLVADTEGVTIEYEMAGDYVVRVRAPAPYLSTTLEVTVG